MKKTGEKKYRVKKLYYDEVVRGVPKIDEKHLYKEGGAIEVVNLVPHHYGSTPPSLLTRLRSLVTRLWGSI